MRYRMLNRDDADWVPVGPLGVFVLIAFATLISYFLQRMWSLDALLPRVEQLNHYKLVSFVATVLIFLVINRQAGRSPLAALGKRPTSVRAFAAAVLVGCGIFLVNYTLVFAERTFEPVDAGLLPAFYDGWSLLRIRLQIDANWLVDWQQLLDLAIVAFFVPVGEEICYRAMLLRSLLRAYRPITAVLVSSAVFAAFHVDASPIYAGLAGLLLGAVYWRTGSLWLCIAAHCAANFLSFLQPRTIIAHAQYPTSVAEQWQFAGATLGLLAVSTATVWLVVRVTAWQKPVARADATGPGDHS